MPLLFIMPVLWALHFALIKMVDAGADPYGALTALLCGIAFICFVGIVITCQLFAFTWPRVRFFAIAGVLAYAIPLFAELRAAPEIDAGILTLIVSLTPVFTVTLAIGLRQIRITYRLFFAVMAGLTGVLILVTQNAGAGASSAGWILVACVVPLCYAIDALYVEHFWPSGLNAVQIAFGETVLSLPIVFVLLLAQGNGIATILPWFAKPDFLILCLATAFEIILFFYLVNKVGAVLVNIATYLILPAGFFWGWLFFDEVLTLTSFVCTLFAVAALLLAGKTDPALKADA